MQLRQFTPVIAGVAVMFVGTASAALPQMVSLPVDTFSCCVNAVCLYYMLCRRRVVQLRSFATDAPVYALSVICSALILANWYQPMQAFLGRLVSGGRQLRTITSALAFSAMTMVICALLRKLMGNLLLKGPEEQEEEIRRFSTAVSKTLHLNELLSLYRDFLQQNLPGLTARVFLRAEGRRLCHAGQYQNGAGLPGCVFAGHPLVRLLQQTGRGITRAEFARTRGYRAMWQKEKDRLEEMDRGAVPAGHERRADGRAHGLFRPAAGARPPHAPGADVPSGIHGGGAGHCAQQRPAVRSAGKESPARPVTNLYNRSYFPGPYP